MTRIAPDRNAEQPEAVPFTRRRGVVLAAGFGAFLLALGAAWFALALVSKERAHWLPVREVSFVGEFKRVEPDSLRRIGAAIQSMGGSLLSIDLNQVKAAVQEVEWVRVADVSRRFPATLVVRVEEHRPAARWESIDGAADDEALVSELGDVFSAETEDALPLLAGPKDSAREVLEAFRSFRAQATAAGVELTAARLSARRAWQLTLGNGATLQLGRNDAGPRLARYLRVQAAVAALRQANVRIDLRYNNGLALSGQATANPTTKRSS